MVHTSKPSTWETEDGGSLGFTALIGETQASEGDVSENKGDSA